MIIFVFDCMSDIEQESQQTINRVTKKSRFFVRPGTMTSEGLGLLRNLHPLEMV